MSVNNDVSITSDGRCEMRIKRNIEGVVTKVVLNFNAPGTEILGSLEINCIHINNEKEKKPTSVQVIIKF